MVLDSNLSDSAPLLANVEAALACTSLTPNTSYDLFAVAGDGAGDACDVCTDTDGDGYGDLGFPASTCPVDMPVGGECRSGRRGL